jgi:hypothetical protein
LGRWVGVGRDWRVRGRSEKKKIKKKIKKQYFKKMKNEIEIIVGVFLR